MTHSKIKTLRKPAILLSVIAALTLLAVGVTAAYVAFKTELLSNEFEPAEVACQVEEQFVDGIKSDVKVRNVGNATAYIRVALVVNFVNDNNGTILPKAPVEGQDYSMELSATNWIKGADGYYYYTKPVSIDAVTTTLISEVRSLNSTNGTSVSFKILASAVQSDPTKAVDQAWGIKVVNGLLAP
jgi:hypothetical protein